MIPVLKEKKVVSLNVTFHDGKPYVSSTELFDFILPNSPAYYARWIALNITKQPQNLPKKGIDYIFSNDVKGHKKPLRRPGRKREELLLTIQFARELCYQTKTLPANEIREFLRAFSA